ncbi:DUF2911 domain-containing protein [Gemmatimonadota bacterium]
MSLPKIHTCSLLAVFCLASFPMSSLAQEGPRLSLVGSVSQRLGTDTDITIVYSRPGVKSRAVWGELVPYGLAPGNEYSEGKPFPWRAGANENTTFENTSDLLVEGQRLPAGKYGLHMIPTESTWTIIFSNKNAEWGSFSYDESEDALRVTVTPVAAPHQEWLVYGFENLAGTSATAYLQWEELKVPVRIELAN